MELKQRAERGSKRAFNKMIRENEACPSLAKSCFSYVMHRGIGGSRVKKTRYGLARLKNLVEVVDSKCEKAPATLQEYS
jgi:hypothetical protein